jgi:hypothetical protein
MGGPGGAYAQAELPFQRHSDESRAAAEAGRDTAPFQRGRVYACIGLARGAGRTDEEGVAALRLNGNTYRPRRVELRNAGLIVAHGSRLTKAGRPAAVWYAVGHEPKGVSDAGTGR